MSDDGLLRAKVRELIRTEGLPDRSPDHVWAVPGTGGKCAVCTAQITRSELDLEVEFIRGRGRGRITLHMHLSCYSLLERERRGLPGAAKTLQNRGHGRGTAEGTGRA
jgi:hypothetical protein